MPSRTFPAINDQKRFWDWHWQHWQERRVLSEWCLRRYDTIFGVVFSLGLHRPRMLDLGCGGGWFTAQLAQLGEVTGLDLSEAAITMARSRFPTVTFISGNLYESLLPTEHFDLVVSQEVIDHVPDQTEFVDRVASFLKPGGYLILSCANKFVMDRLEPGQFPTQPPEHIQQYLSIRGLRRLLRPHFRLIRHTSIIPLGHRGILRPVNSPRLNSLLGRMIPHRTLEALKERAGLGYTLIVVARRHG